MIIVTGLLLANILAFTATSYFFSSRITSQAENKTSPVNYFKKGWQVVSWTFSLVDYIGPDKDGDKK